MLNAPTYYTTLAANNALPDPTFCNQCKPWKPIAFHRCRSRQIFGGAQDFAQISPNLPEKTLKKMTSKKWLHFIPLRAHVFQIKALQAPFLPKFPPNFPKFPPTYPRNNWRKITSKKRNVCTLISSAIFVKSKHIKRFCQGFHTFCPHLHRSNQNFWVWARALCTPTSYTSGLKLASKNFHATRMDARKSRFAPNAPDRFCLKC